MSRPWFAGRITTESLVNCARCGNHEYISKSVGSSATDEAKRLGWTRKPAEGWVCPRCLKMEAAE